MANVSKLDINVNNLKGIYDIKDEMARELLKGKVDTMKVLVFDEAELTLDATDNTTIRCTQELTSLFLTFPEDLPIRYTSSIVFKSGTTPTSFEYPSSLTWSGDSIVAGKFVPEPDMIYDIIFWYNGFNINSTVRGTKI